MTTIHVFPGQGSQRLGMGSHLFDQYPNLVRQADAVLGYSVAELCREGPPERLADTRYTQCAMYVVGALSYVDVVRTGRVVPDVVAGHSLGEYVALFAAGVVDFVTGLELVAERAALMADAGPGAMVAVMGLGEPELRELLASHGSGTVDVANINAPDQIVVSGPAAAVRELTPELSRRATAVVPLPVSGAFHSRHMATAAERFRRFLDGYLLARLRIPVVANVTAAPHRDGAVAELLARQLTEPVRWRETVEYLLDQPDPEIHEIGPGTVLTGLLRRVRNGRTPTPPTGSTTQQTIDVLHR
ncbi:ACP S-malonyltransferase [Streptomyces sp. MAR4 CNY-716]